MKKILSLERQLNENCTFIHSLLIKSVQKYPKLLKMTSHPESPVKQIQFLGSKLDEIDQLIDRVVNDCEENGIAIVKTKKVPSDHTFKNKSIRITVASDFTKSDMSKCASTFEEIISKIDIPL